MEARKLATEGKAIVWIDSGLHASEVLLRRSTRPSSPIAWSQARTRKPRRFAAT